MKTSRMLKLSMLALSATFATEAAMAGMNCAHVGTPVEEMSCAEAQAYVVEHGRYYTATPDGPVPIYPVWGFDLPVDCGRQRPVYHFRFTTDNAQCPVGYGCTSH